MSNLYMLLLLPSAIEESLNIQLEELKSKRTELSNELDELNIKIKSIENLLAAYSNEKPQNEKKTSGKGGTSLNYPIDGTWRQKIKYVLEKSKTPLNAEEIYEKVTELEGSKKDVPTNFPQYCSNMEKVGILLKERQKGNKRYVYKVA